MTNFLRRHFSKSAFFSFVLFCSIPFCSAQMASGGGATPNRQILDVSSLYRTIWSLRGVNGSGVADSLNKLVVVTGTVHSINFRPAGLEFGISDFSGGINIFRNTNLNPFYDVSQGDSIRVRGTLNQFRGLSQIVPDSISIIQVNRNVKTPVFVAQLNEQTESRLLSFENLQLTSHSVWGSATSYNAKALMGGNTTDTIVIRVDTDAQISVPRPTGAFNLIGYGSQFAPSLNPPFIGGYQIYPRSNADFSLPFSGNMVYAYVANIIDNSVSVINTVTDQVWATIPVGIGPGNIAVSPNASRIYTTNQGSHTVSVVDAASQSVIAQVPIFGVPAALIVSQDGSKVYVSSFNFDVLTVIYAQTNTVVNSAFLNGELRGVVISPDGSKLYVAKSGLGTVAVLNAANLSPITEILTGGQCSGLALNPDGSRLYVTIFGTTTLKVINTSNYVVLPTVTVGSSPSGVAVSQNGSRVYVSNMGSNNVTVLNGSTNTVVTTISLGQNASPDGISIHPDGTKVYVANAGSDNVSVISTAANQVLSVVPVGRAPYSGGNMLPLVYQVPCPTVTFAPTTLSDATVWVPYNGTINQTGLVNPVFTISSGALPGGLSLSSTGLLSGTPINSGAYSFTVTANSGLCSGSQAYTLAANLFNAVFAYVPCAESDSVLVINTSTNIIVASIAVGDFPVGVSVSPKRTRVYVTNKNSDNVSVISSATNLLIATIPVGSAPGYVVVSPDGNRIYVLNSLGSSVSVIDRATNAVITTIPTLPNPSGIAILPDGSKLYISHRDDDKISIINTVNNTVTTTLTSVGKPKGLAIDHLGSRLYVANSLTNNVRVFDLATNAVVFAVPVGNGPNSIAVNPNGTEFYVTNSTAKTVSIVRTTGNVTATISVANTPQGISLTPDGYRVLVAISDAVAGKVAVIKVTVSNQLAYVAVKKAPYALGNMVPTVFGPCPNISILPAAIPNGQERVAYTATLSQTGLQYPVFYETGTWPAGLYILPSGEILGTPTVSGSFSLGVTVKSGTCTQYKYYLINIAPNSNILHAYIPNTSSGTISVVNIESEMVSSTITSSFSPTSVAVSPDGSKIYVCGPGNNKVEVISRATHTITATLTVGSGPNFLALNSAGTRLFVCNNTGKTVSVFNTQTNAGVATIRIPGEPLSMDIIKDGSRLYVADYTKIKFWTINTATNSIVDSINAVNLLGQTESPTPVLVDRSGKRLYALCYNRPKVFVYDLLSKALIGEIPLPQQAFSMAFNPEGDQLYVTVYPNKVVVINPILMTVISTITGLSSGYGISFTPDGTKAIVALSQTPVGKAAIINTSTLTISSILNLGSGTLAVGNMMPINYIPCANVSMSPANGNLPNGIKGSAYSGSISQSGFNSATFILSSGTLPSGLVMNSSGIINGTPTVSGSYNFVVTVYQGGCLENKAFTLFITCSGVSIPNISGVNSICAGSSTQLSVSNPQPNTTYLWSNGATAYVSIFVNSPTRKKKYER